MSKPLLETLQLSRRFGALAAVDSVSLAIETGEIHALIGPNGAGKSTFLNLLSGEHRPSSGSVRFKGRDVTRFTPDRISRLGIGRSYQSANVFPELSCADCVWLAAQSRVPARSLYFGPGARAASEIGERAERALHACKLVERRRTPARELSYGEQRQLELGMILATGPELLLLDEPLAGLGHDEALSVIALLREVVHSRTVVLIEHDMDAVFSIANRITVLAGGRVLETGSPAQIRQSRAVREAYLGDEQP